jgi:hypothetical protein
LSIEGSLEIRESIGVFTVVSSLIQMLQICPSGRFFDIKGKGTFHR